jgi:hypothetical protein
LAQSDPQPVAQEDVAARRTKRGSKGQLQNTEHGTENENEPQSEQIPPQITTQISKRAKRGSKGQLQTENAPENENEGGKNSTRGKRKPRDELGSSAGGDDAQVVTPRRRRDSGNQNGKAASDDVAGGVEVKQEETKEEERGEGENENEGDVKREDENSKLPSLAFSARRKRKKIGESM